MVPVAHEQADRQCELEQRESGVRISEAVPTRFRAEVEATGVEDERGAIQHDGRDRDADHLHAPALGVGCRDSRKCAAIEPSIEAIGDRPDTSCSSGQPTSKFHGTSRGVPLVLGHSTPREATACAGRVDLSAYSVTERRRS